MHYLTYENPRPFIRWVLVSHAPDPYDDIGLTPRTSSEPTSYEVVDICWLEDEATFTATTSRRLSVAFNSWVSDVQFREDTAIVRHENGVTILWNFVHNECSSWDYSHPLPLRGVSNGYGRRSVHLTDGPLLFQVFAGNTNTHVFYAGSNGVSCVEVPPLQPLVEGRPLPTHSSGASVDSLPWPHGISYTGRHVRGVDPYVAVPGLFCPSSYDRSPIAFRVRARTNSGDAIQVHTYCMLFNQEFPRQSTLQVTQRLSLPSHYDSRRIRAESRRPCDGKLAMLWVDVRKSGGHFITISPSAKTSPASESSAPSITMLQPARFDPQPAGNLESDYQFCPVSGRFLVPHYAGVIPRLELHLYNTL